MKYDIIIIGAGIAGLTAAYTLKARNINFAVLEADKHIGGRAVTHHTASGAAVDLGAHWLHGDDNPLREVLDRYQLPYENDKADEVTICRRRDAKRVNIRDWLEEAIDKKKATAVLKGEIPDCAIPELAVDTKARARLVAFARMWDGLSPPLWPSAREFLMDKSTPGGLQVIGGVGKLVEKLADDIGRQHIHTGKPVKAVKSKGNRAAVSLATGEEWTAKKVLFTGSPGVIKSGDVKFEPNPKRQFREHMARIAMGDMNRIAVEVLPAFFESRRISNNLSFELLTGYPHFCHVRGAGSPVISLFVAGPRARQIETMKDEQVLAYFCKILTRVRELSGFAGYIVGEPVVSRWSANPFVRGSYSSLLPGGERSWPLLEGSVYFCGEAFDKQYPGSLAGAARSGKAAALLAADSLDETGESKPPGHEAA